LSAPDVALVATNTPDNRIFFLIVLVCRLRRLCAAYVAFALRLSLLARLWLGRRLRRRGFFDEVEVLGVLALVGAA
tara:strand:- start:6824 stop:7051 length:228 start_codon:yes stop_codon:yes gene_type:complete